MLHRWLAFLLCAALPAISLAADCTEVSVARNNAGYTVKRYLLADGKTGTGASTKCVPLQTLPLGGHTTTAAPWDFYRFIAEEGDTCTSWTAVVRDYPLNTTTSQCRGTCDAHTVVTLDKTATTSRSYREPLGEAQDVNFTAITCSGGVSVYVDFYYRNEGK